MRYGWMTLIGMYDNLEGSINFCLRVSFRSGKWGDTPSWVRTLIRASRVCGETSLSSPDGQPVHKKGKGRRLRKRAGVDSASKTDIPLPFVGGAIGYVGYDVIRQYEKLPNVNPNELQAPEAYLMFYKQFISYDHYQHKMTPSHSVFPRTRRIMKQSLPIWKS